METLIIVMKAILNNDYFKVFLILIILDIIFGVLRAIKERTLNSTIGIDGSIRKIGMIVSIVFLKLIDIIIDFNCLGFIPEAISSYLNLQKLGIGDLFSILYIIFEGLSIMKNAILCKLPIPIKLQNLLENLMKEFTGEIKEKEE